MREVIILPVPAPTAEQLQKHEEWFRKHSWYYGNFARDTKYAQSTEN